MLLVARVNPEFNEGTIIDFYPSDETGAVTEDETAVARFILTVLGDYQCYTFLPSVVAGVERSLYHIGCCGHWLGSAPEELLSLALNQQVQIINGVDDGSDT